MFMDQILIKMAVLCKLIQCNSYQNPNSCSFFGNYQTDIIFIWQYKQNQSSKNNIEKEESWSSHNSQFESLLQS